MQFMVNLRDELTEDVETILHQLIDKNLPSFLRC